MHEGQPKTTNTEAIAQSPATVAPPEAGLAARSPRHREALETLERGDAMACSDEGFRQDLRVVTRLYASPPASRRSSSQSSASRKAWTRRPGKSRGAPSRPV